MENYFLFSICFPLYFSQDHARDFCFLRRVCAANNNNNQNCCHTHKTEENCYDKEGDKKRNNMDEAKFSLITPTFRKTFIT